MTDERAPGSAPNSDTDPTPPAPDVDAPTTQIPAPQWDAPAAQAPAPPPPLAPLVNQAASPAPAPAAPPTFAAPPPTFAAPPPTFAAPPPAYTPPPVPPPAMPQPAVAWATAPAVVVAKPRRTVLAMIAGILLLLGGIAGILFGILIIVVGGAFGSMFGQIPGMSDIPELNGADAGAVLGAVVAFVGILLIAFSLAYLLSGIGVLRNSNWARVLGIIVGILGGLFWLSGVTGSSGISDPSDAASSRLFSIVALAIHAYVAIALLFFWRTRASGT